MALFVRENPSTIRNSNSLFADINNEFDDFNNNELINHPLISLNSLYPYYFNHPDLLEKQILEEFEKERELYIDFNLSEDEKNYYIYADLPGLTKDQIKMELSVDDRSITISSDYSYENEIVAEDEFSRTFSIPENADINNIQPKLEDGVLEITIAKIEPQVPKIIITYCL